LTLLLEIPGRAPLTLEFLLLDVNGTLSDRGELIDGVDERLAAVREQLEPRLLSADTFGTLGTIAERLALPAQTVATAMDKLAVLSELGANRCVAIGNGSNDREMLAEAALGIAIIGPEGCSAPTLSACDLVCRSILDALDLLRDPRALAATLRS
jgi:soluble P-type ATPase